MVLIQKEGSPGEDLAEPACTLFNTTEELHKGICQQVSKRFAYLFQIYGRSEKMFSKQ